MKQEIARRWVKALRSGKYKQTRESLFSFSLDQDRKFKTYCCLGVLTALWCKEKKKGLDKAGRHEDNDWLSEKVQYWAGMHTPNGYYGRDNDSLAVLNDTPESNFDLIAKTIEEHVKDL